MRTRHSIPFLLALISIISFYFLPGCKKTSELSFEAGNTSVDQNLVNKIKAYLDVRQQQYIDSGKIVLTQIKQSADYSSIQIENFNQSEKLILLPLKGAFQTRNKTATKSFKYVVLFQDSKNEFRRADLVEFVPTNSKLTKLPESTISKAFNAQSISIDGKISMFTLHNRNICDLIYKNGKIINYNYTLPKKNGVVLNPNKNEALSTSCIDWYWEYYENGILIYEEYAFTTCSGCDEEQSFKPSTIENSVACGGGGGTGNNGGGNYQALFSVDSVKKDLIDSCFIKNVAKITDSRIKNTVIQMFVHTFVAYGGVANITFTEDPSLVDSQGDPRASDSHVSGPNTWEIVLNPAYSTTASNEFWTSVIIHEVEHGFITILKSQNGPLTLDQQHQLIFSYLIDEMSGLLMDIYPNLTQHDADALSIGGLDHVLKEEVNGNYVFIQAWDTFAQQSYQISLQDAENTRQLYKNGTKGTLCQ